MSSVTQTNNKTIAKNTMYMYIRMFVIMAVSLYTTRITFNALGISNYGIYNVVGSIIVFFTFINSGLTTATRRYITAEIAIGNEESQQNVFNLSLYSHALIGGIIFILAETVGLYVVNYTLNIPSERMFAANVVYQMSILAALWGVFQAPYQAAITAYEHMKIYAYLSIFEAILKLVVAYMILYSKGDKLIIYSILIFASGFLNTFITRLYCIHKFSICKFKHPHNKALLKEMFGYMGWSLWGQFVVVLTSQGVSMLVNVFFSVAANAAMGISNQITNIVTNFVTNFQVVFHPQITKQYVQKDSNSLNKLVIRTSRYSNYLVLIFMVPICCQIHTFLSLWLGNYPKFAVEFCVLTLLGLFIDSMAAPLWMILSADKNIKKYQIVTSFIYSFNFIGAYLFLKFGFEPYFVMIARIVVYAVALTARLIMVKEKVESFPIFLWIKKVIFRSVIITAIPFAFYYTIHEIVLPVQIIDLLVKVGSIFVVTALSILLLGLEKQERDLLFLTIKNKLHIYVR